MSVLAILQARTSSSRLPGKVLKPILGQPMMARQIERLAGATSIDRLVVATSNEDSDTPVADLCAQLGVGCYRGSLHDVLGRMYEAACQFGPPKHVVRLTADCPLADPDVIDLVVEKHQKLGADYSGNGVVRTFADGLDVEVMTFAALTKAHEEATDPLDREHVTRYIYRRPRLFSFGAITQDFDQAHYRWTVDTQEDFDMATAVYEALYPNNPNFRARDIERFLMTHPEIDALNDALGPRVD